MEKPSGTCFAGGGTNELELRRSLWLEAGSYYHRPKTLKPRPVRVSRFWANINEIQNRHEAGNTGMCLVGLSSGFEFLVVWGPCLGAKTPKRLPRGLAAGGSHAALGRERLDPPGRDLTHAAERGPGVGGDLPKTAAREEREAGPVTQRVHGDV